VTRAVRDLAEIADGFGAVVLDQWGVLHDGTAPYPGAVEAVRALAERGVRLAVLSNSGKRAALNAERIADIGFPADALELVMTSGEALWRDLDSGRVAVRHVVPIERAPGDAAAFCEGLNLTLHEDVSDAEAILLMGVFDGAEPARYTATLEAALAAGLPVICTNPDRASPRAGGATVSSPGALAHAYAARGGEIRFYGKPHAPVFEAVEEALGLAPNRLLMVGDSLEHDVAGGDAAGWSTCFVRGGLHHAAFSGQDPDAALANLLRAERAPAPDYALDTIGGPHA
jgi:HAD superfamily hydrolase (TIGR01459 family)